MKKYTAVILLLILLLSACGDQEQQPSIDLNFYANETTARIVREPVSTAETMSMDDYIGASYIFEGVELGITQEELTYSGGEMEVEVRYWSSDIQRSNYYFNFGVREYGLVDIGIFLFLDGRIQPCRTAGENEYSYMHTVTPGEKFEIFTQELYFTPVTGQAGDTLELQVLCVIWPDYFPDQGQHVYQHTAYMAGCTAAVSFDADPGEIQMPQVPDRVVSITTQAQDSDAEELSYQTTFRYSSSTGIRYGIRDLSEPQLYRFEMSGNPGGKYALWIFVDNQPVSVAEEDLVFLENEEGCKTIVNVMLDLSDYDGSMVIYPILVPRNLLSGGCPAWDHSISALYLSAADDFYDLMGWER